MFSPPHMVGVSKIRFRSDKEYLMTGTPWKAVLVFSIPIAVGYLLQIMYGTVDTIIVGRKLGEAALSAVGNSVTLTTVFGCVSWGLSAGMNAVLSRYSGGEKDEAMRKCFGTSMAMNLTAGFMMTILCFFLAEPIYRFVMGVPDDIMDLTVRYTQIFGLGFTFQFGYNAIGSMMRSFGDSLTIMYVLIATTILNTVLDLYFLLGLGMDADGTAIATAICQVISFFSLLYLYNRKYKDYAIKRGTVKFDWGYVHEILEASAPMAIQQVAIFGSAILFQQAANSYGSEMIASYAVERRLEAFYRLPISAIGAGMVTFVGLHYGAKQYDRMFMGIRQLLIMSVVITVVISAISIVIAPFLTSIFGLSGTSQDYCTEHLRVINLLFPLFALYFPMLSVFQAVKRPNMSLIVVILEIVIRLFFLWALMPDDLLGYHIIWWNALFGWIVCIIVTFLYYKKGRWRNDLERPPEATAG